MTSLAARRSLAVHRSLATLLLALLCAVACALVPAQARADGDPGSDVLVLQNLFAASDANLSPAEQLQLGDLLNATASVGQPVRVAIIAHSDDLGTVTSLWKQPQTYAEYLGAELRDNYTGRLLVVTPNGFGVYWNNNAARETAMQRALGSLTVGGDSAAALVAATKSAVYGIEGAAGIAAGTLAKHLSDTTTAGTRRASVPATTPAAPSHGAGATANSTEHGHPDAVLILVAVAFLVFYVVLRRGWRPKWRSRRGADARDRGDGRLGVGWLKGLRVKPVALLPTALLLIVVAALVINHSGSSGPAGPDASLAANAGLDQGSALGDKPAPPITLTDETGRSVSLSQYRGKVVILGFIDAECQTICPLTTEAMLDAKRSLGSAGKDVQLLGVDANWKSTQIEDVANYTSLHGLTGQWHFLTGSVPQLEHVWTAYGVNEKELMDEDSNAIDHVAALYVIDPEGHLRTVYTTQSSYASIPQLGQLLAHEASRLLPSHPKVSTHYSYAQIKGITPAQTVNLPRSGGGSLTLGPGKAHLYLFFATWDTQTTSIGPELSELNAYDRAAKAKGLPALTAVDEGSVEPSPQALPAFLKTLPRPLNYPVAIDTSGKVADGYEVEGEPWFVLTSATGQIKWNQEVYTAGWPSLTGLEQEVRAALSHAPVVPTSEAAALRELAGSPAPLASLHAQASQLLPGGYLAFYERLSKLKGYPIVVNIWASTCQPCQKEFHLFANASALYGKQVAFVGADNEDLAGNARTFLRGHQVSYPSYQTQTERLDPLLTGGLEGTPTTVFISPEGKVLYAHIGQYETQGSLDLDIEDYALGGAN